MAGIDVMEEARRSSERKITARERADMLERWWFGKLKLRREEAAKDAVRQDQ